MARFKAFTKITLATLVLALAVSGPALAQSDPSTAQYDDSITQIVQGNGGSGDKPQSDTGTSSTGKAPLQQNVVGGLPITGLDVIALLAVAIAMTSLGFALRRLTLTNE